MVSGLDIHIEWNGWSVPNRISLSEGRKFHWLMNQVITSFGQSLFNIWYLQYINDTEWNSAGLQFKGSPDPSHFILEISERGGSDIQRLWIWERPSFKLFWVDLKILHSISESLYFRSASFRHSKIIWLWSELPWNCVSIVWRLLVWRKKTNEKPGVKVSFLV